MRLIKVYLNVYDFMCGNGCLEAIGMGAYHSAIEIEYSTSHSVTSSTASAWCPLIHGRAE